LGFKTLYEHTGHCSAGTHELVFLKAEKRDSDSDNEKAIAGYKK